jgi:BirA family biotin operon repressor/biotin-[acetyl-CoA-carboxylase] ligase
LTLLAAVAVVEALMDAGIEAEIKWPNDVLAGGKKIAGILTELSADVERVHFAIVGIGVNLNAEMEDFPEEIREGATSVRQMRGQVVSRALFTAALWARLERWLERHATEGFAPVRHAWSEHAVTLGQSVMVKSEAQELVGTAESIDDSGALQVRSADGVLHRILAGDVEQIRSKKS